MQKEMIKARKISGLAKFERECSCSVGEKGHRTKRYNIRGTMEHGKHQMLKTETLRIFSSIMKEK